MGTVQGPAAIQAFMEKAIPGANAAHNFHLLSNFVIDVQGDTATAWSRWQFVAPGQDGRPVVAQAGRYDDTLVREDGRWKFKRRVAANDLPLPRPAAPEIARRQTFAVKWNPGTVHPRPTDELRVSHPQNYSRFTAIGAHSIQP